MQVPIRTPSLVTVARDNIFECWLVVALRCCAKPSTVMRRYAGGGRGILIVIYDCGLKFCLVFLRTEKEHEGWGIFT
jgi:hypothetical protein